MPSATSLRLARSHMLSSTSQLLAASNSGGTTIVDFLPLVGAILALTGVVGVAAWNQYQSRRDRRRDLYSEAYKAVVSWAEMPYRVRRRDPDQPYELVARFHDLQEAIDYHDGWISTESPELARAYRAFVSQVKAKTREAIARAWEQPPCDPRNGFTPPDGQQELPNVEAEKRQFLVDINDHLAFDHDRSEALRRRYPEPRRSAQ